MIAIYARVSTGQQAAEGTSLDLQIELCSKKARALGVDNPVIKIYREKGFSGEDIIRPAIEELRRDVKKGLITHVICTHPDRLSRDLTDKLVVCKEFQKYGSELIFVDTDYQNTPEGLLFFNMLSVIAQYELDLIRKRTSRGRIKAVRDHKRIMPMRTAPYGYDLVAGKLLVNRKEARIVRQIYEWYVFERISMREIGDRLYRMGALPKRGESACWNASSIRRVLTSEIYIGTYYYNRRKVKKVPGEKTDSGNPRKSCEYRDRSEWIEVEVPAIVGREIYRMAQETKLKNMKVLGKNVKREYLLKSLIRCGHCGRIWQAVAFPGKPGNSGRKEYQCYRCAGKSPRRYGGGVPKCEASGTIEAKMLDSYVWGIITGIVLDPETFTADLKSYLSSDSPRLVKTIREIKKQMDQKGKEKGKIIMMYRKDLVDEKEMTSQVRKIVEEEVQLQAELTRSLALLQGKQKLKFNESIMDIAAAIHDAVERDKRGEPVIEFKIRRLIVEMLIDQIIIEFRGDNVILQYNGALNHLINEKQAAKPGAGDPGLGLQPQEIRRQR